MDDSVSLDIRDDGSFRLNMKYFIHTHSTKRMFNRRWEELFGRPQRPKETELDSFHEDIAHSGQKVVEEIMVKMATHVRKTADGIEVHLELQAGGYNGSTYTLAYDPERDILRGVYFQAVAQQSYEVYFQRAR